MLSFILQIIYIILPGIFANITPVIFRKYFKKLAVPIDLGKSYKGKRILGDNKTFRGYIIGIAFSIGVAYIQRWLYAYPFFQNLSFIDYNAHNMLLWGFLIGFGSLFGDTVESFIKRRLDIAPGKSFIPWDQIDAVIGGMVFIYPIYHFSFVQIATAITLSLFLSLSLNYLAFLLGLRKEKEVKLI